MQICTSTGSEGSSNPTSAPTNSKAWTRCRGSTCFGKVTHSSRDSALPAEEEAQKDNTQE